MLNNEFIVSLFDIYIQFLELKGADPFKIRAYRKAVYNINNLNFNIEEYFRKKGKLPNIEGVGKNIASKIIEIIQKGTFDELEELKKEYPLEILELFKIPALGPKKIAHIYNTLGIKNIRELEEACRENKLKDIKGFGQRTQEKILEGLELIKLHSGRKLWAEVEGSALELMEKLTQIDGIVNVEVAGSFRRKLETIKDIDVVVSSNLANIHDNIVQSNHFANFKEKGDSKISFLIDSLTVDVRICKVDDFYPMLHHFTGNKFHNEKLRSIAKSRGYKLNEYGLYCGDNKIPIKSEDDIYKKLDLPYIIPEMREGIFEFDRVIDLTKLIDLPDIKGIFHIHTNYSDGINSIEDIVKKATELNLEYIGISDHSESAYYAGGLTEERLIEQRNEIEDIRNKYPSIKIFHGIESDIKVDGSLDYRDPILGMLDFVIASVHSSFTLSEEEMTNRIVKAMKNPYTTMLGHMTSRLLLSRNPYKINIREVLSVASASKTIIELNANPQRLDIDWRYIPEAMDKNIMISINPDAHRLSGLTDYRYGVFIGRKGGLIKENTLNTFDANNVEKYLKNLKSYKQSQM
jgi:DNA polymerase (family 10)